MISIIQYIASIITKWVNVLDVNFFPDISISLIDLIFGCIVLSFIFKLCFGGFKELERYSNLSILGSQFLKRNSKNISNSNRKAQINDIYFPKHARND